MTVVHLQVPVIFPAKLTRRPSAGGHREEPPRHSRANRALSLDTNPSTSPTMPQKQQKPRAMRKVSDPSTNRPEPQHKRPPSRTGQLEHPGSPSILQHNPHGRGRKTSGPPIVTPRPQQRRATSRSSTREQDPTFRQSPPRQRPHCRDWLKGNCPRGLNCFFTHDTMVCSFP